jgi:hypothetical protein
MHNPNYIASVLFACRHESGLNKPFFFQRFQDLCLGATVFITGAFNIQLKCVFNWRVAFPRTCYNRVFHSGFERHLSFIWVLKIFEFFFIKSPRHIWLTKLIVNTGRRFWVLFHEQKPKTNRSEPNWFLER